MVDDLEIICEVCKNELSGKQVANRLLIEPCEHCLSNAEQEGDDAGYARGIEEGKNG